MANLGQIGTNTNYRLGNINTPSYLNEDDIKAIESVDQGRSSAPKISNSTLGDYVRTVGMGIPGITSGLSEVAAQGAEALLPESYSKPVREAASYLQDNAAKATKRLGEKRSQRFQEEASQPLISPNKEGEDKPFYERFNKDATLNTIGSTVAESAPGIVAMGGMGGVLSKAMGSGKILSPILEKMGIGGVVAEHFPSLAKLADTAIPGAISLESKVNKMIAASVATRGGQVASEGLFSAGQNAADKRQEALSTPLEVYRNNPLFHDELAKQDTNLPLEQRELLARESLANQAADHVFSETFKSTAGIAALTGGGALGDLAASGKAPITSALHKTLLKEGLKEGLAQELPQSYNEQLISNIATKKFIDPNRDVMDGVVDAALKGGIAGGIMGGGVGGLSHLSKSDNQKIAEGKKVDSVVDMEGNEHKITTGQLNTLYNKALSLYSSQPDITSKGYINSLNNIKESINKVLEVGEGKEVDPVKKEEAEFILQNIELGHSNLVKAKERMDAEDRQKEEAAKEVVKPEVEQFKAVESDSSTLTQENKEAPIRTWGDINAADISRYNSVAPTERVAPAQPDSSYYNNLKESLTPQEESQMSPEELRGLMKDTSSVEDNYPQVQEVSPRLWGSVEGEDTSRYNGEEPAYRSEVSKGDERYYSNLKDSLSKEDQKVVESLKEKYYPKLWGDIEGEDNTRYSVEEPNYRSEAAKPPFNHYATLQNKLKSSEYTRSSDEVKQEMDKWDIASKDWGGYWELNNEYESALEREGKESPSKIWNKYHDTIIKNDYDQDISLDLARRAKTVANTVLGRGIKTKSDDTGHYASMGDSEYLNVWNDALNQLIQANSKTQEEPQVPQSPQTTKLEAPKIPPKSKRIERYEWVSKTATEDQVSKMGTKEQINFHYFNPNGLLSKVDNALKPIQELVNSGDLNTGYLLRLDNSLLWDTLREFHNKGVVTSRDVGMVEYLGNRRLEEIEEVLEGIKNGTAKSPKRTALEAKVQEESQVPQSQEAMKASIFSQLDNVNKISSSKVEKKLSKDEEREVAELSRQIREMKLDPLYKEEELQALIDKRDNIRGYSGVQITPTKTESSINDIETWGGIDDDDGFFFEVETLRNKSENQYDSAGYLIKEGVDHKANKAAFNIFVNNLKSHIKNNERIEFHYIEDFDSHKFPETVIRASNQDAFRGTRAFVYRSAFTTKFYFNGSKFKSPSDLAGTFMHEVVGHYGVRELFGKEGYDAFLFRMIRTYPAFRKEAIAISKRWAVYLEDWKKDQGFSNLTGDEIQEYLKTLPSNQVQTFDDVMFPNSVALRVADEYVAELAKAKYFSKEFMKEKVGLNKEDRTLLSAQRERWLDQFILKIRNLLKKVFGNHLDKVSEDDVLNAIAQSFDNTFESINPQFFLISTKPGASITTIPLETTNQSPVTPKLRTTLKKTFKVEKGVISREEEEVSDQLEDNEIINHTLAPAVADLTTFIELQNSDSFEHAKTIRSKFWNDINDAFDNSILAPFKALGNMSYQRAYVAIQNIFKGKIAVMEDSVKGMSSVLNSLNSIQNQAVFEYMTTPNATLDGVPLTKLQRETVLKAKEAINAIGESLYQMGNISRESYEKNKDAYLHTVYMKYVDEYRGSAKRTSILSWMKKKKNLSERERLALGQIRDVKFLIPETIGVIARDHILLNMFDTLNRASISNDLHWVLTTTDKIKLPGSSKKVPIDKAYDELERRKFIVDYWESKNKHTFGGVGDKSNKRIDQLKLDIQSIEQQIKDLEDSVLENAFKHAQSTGKTKTESRDDYLKENYMRLPNRPHFGSLRNAYARKEIYNDLDAMTSAYNLQDKNVVEKFFASGGTLERINRFWKMSKVALNPGSWVRNTLGNFSLLDLSTSTPSIKLVGMLHQEISQALGKGESEYWKLANEYGLFGTTFAAVELQDIYSKYGDDLKRAQAEFEKRGGTPWDAHLPFLDERFMAFMRMAGHRIDNSTGKAFALVEGTFKTVAFRDYIEIWEKQNKEQYPQGWRGLGDDEKKVLFTKAASHANDSLFDYSQVNSVVKTLRRIPLGSPFLTFAYKAGPIAVKSMVNHPIKFAKYATLPALVTMISAFANDWDDKDISRFKRSLPDYYRTNPGVAFLPFKDSLGRVQILPLDYFIPWAQWASAGRKVYENFVEDQGVSPVSTTLRSAGTFANEFGFLGGPVPTGIAAMLTGKDEFTGKDILTPGASGDTHLRESMLYAYDQLTPTWLSSHGWFVKMYQAFGERPSVNRFGDIKYTPGQAVSDITGFRPTGIDERAGLENRKFGFEMKLKELATLRTKIIKDRNNMDKISELKDINFREKLLRQRMKEELSIK